MIFFGPSGMRTGFCLGWIMFKHCILTRRRIYSSVLLISCTRIKLKYVVMTQIQIKRFWVGFQFVEIGRHNPHNGHECTKVSCSLEAIIGKNKLSCKSEFFNRYIKQIKVK